MGLLNFIDTGFLIILGILLLISGGIMFYCYRRLNLLEDSIINQGKILQNLIINLQSSNSGGSAQKDNNEVNAHPEESLNKETFDSFINPLNKKINVSDDDDDDDSSNSDFSENEENYEEDGTENLNNIKLANNEFLFHAGT